MSNSSPAQILIIDDNEEIRELLALICETIGLRTLQASERAEALSIIRTCKPQVILMDFAMRGMGPEEFISSLPSISTARVILMTASNAKEIACSLGIKVYLQKPFLPDDLEDAIKALLATRTLQG